jgi:ABC-2 type transport system permease protein
VIRAFVTGVDMHFRMFSRSAFEVMAVIAWPLMITTIAYFLYRHSLDRRQLFSIVLGSTMVAVWASTTNTCGGAVRRLRQLGTLELMVAAPVPFVTVLASTAVAAAAMGLYTFACTTVFGRLAFGIPIVVDRPGLFALALVGAVASVGALGVMLSATMFVFRNANLIANSFEYPVWLVSGLLFPLGVLPGWTRPISYALAPTWGMLALRRSALGGAAWAAVGMCLLLTAVYLAVALVSLRRFERLARERATLALTV